LLTKKRACFFIICCLFCFILAGCGEKPVVSSQSSGNPEYENQKITFEGEIGETKEISVAEMRQLPQKEIQCSFQRTTGMVESFKAAGPTFNDVLVGGGFSTSFSDIVPAMVVAVFGKQITEKPLTKPAKSPGDKIIIVGETGTDGNDTLYRAGLVPVMKPALACFEEERLTMEASLAAFATGKIKACSDLGAAGIGAAVCESARFGGLGARVELDKVPVKTGDITPEEVFICETQARMLFQVEPQHVDEVLEAIRSKNGITAVIGEITDQDYNVFTYQGQVTATIPNKPNIKKVNWGLAVPAIPVCSSARGHDPHAPGQELQFSPGKQIFLRPPR
jgi:hypothetical protein